MRTYEIILLLANLSTLFLVFRKRSRKVWLGIAGVNLVILCLHGVVEGFRFQLIFSYAYVVLLTVYAWVKSSGRFPFKSPPPLKAALLILSAAGLLLTSILTYVFPVFTLPKPTGSYEVGVKYFNWVDANRPDPFLDPPSQKRELMVKVYYPAEKDHTAPYASYFHQSPAYVKSFIGGFGIPAFLFQHLSRVTTNGKEGLPLSDREPSYPVILFSHGAGTSVEVQTSQCEDLASHGYIVAAIDHPYISTVTQFPDRLVSAREATATFDTSEATAVLSQIMVDDSEFVITSLNELNEGKIDSNFKGKLNLNEIGAIGHSLGGSAAYNLAVNDSRIKAAIDLDGDVYITPRDTSKMAPFLMLASDQNTRLIQNREPLMMKNINHIPDEMREKALAPYGGNEKAYNEDYEHARQNILGLIDVLIDSGNFYHIEGSSHLEFTDMGLFIGNRQLRELLGLGGKIDPEKCLEITKSVTLAFFDQHLKDETENALESLTYKHPQLKKLQLTH